MDPLALTDGTTIKGADAETLAVGVEAIAVESAESKSCPTASGVTSFASNDPENPQNWPAIRRWLVVITVSLMTMVSVLATTMITPAAPQIVQSFHVHDNLYRTLLVSIWDLGEGVGPFVAAPLSERFGRSPVFHTSNLIGLVCIVACALSPNVSMLVAFRFLGGCFLNAPTLAPAIIGDVIRQEERGKAMAIGMGLRQLAPFVAPISGASINQAWGWRWTQWILAMEVGVFGTLAFAVVRETYAVKILEHRATPKDTGDTRPRPARRIRVDVVTIRTTMTRPVRILVLCPAVLLVSLYTGLVCGMLFLVTTTLTPVMEENYHFSEGSVGFTYIASCVGFVLAMLLYGFTSDRYLKYRRAREGGGLKPEHRLAHMLVGACTLPVGFLLYGWTAAYHVHYIVPLIGTGIISFSLVLAMLPSENYLVDAYGIHSASAIAACMILRAVFGAAFPLVGPPLYQRLGLGWGNSLLALIAAAFIPLVALLLKYGERLRERENSHDVKSDRRSRAASAA